MMMLFYSGVDVAASCIIIGIPGILCLRPGA